MPEKSTIDGIAAAPEQPEKSKTDGLESQESPVGKVKMTMLATVGLLYFAYALICLALVSIYPSASSSGGFALFGALLCAVVGIGFLAVSGLLLLRVSRSGAAIQRKKIALIKIVAAVIPGLLLSIITPLLILRQPPLSIAIVSPTGVSELVAPVTITFSAEDAVQFLAQKGFTPIQYLWDINADGTTDQETTDPMLTATFEQQGIQTVSVTMRSVGGSLERAVRRFAINRASFSVSPSTPIVNQPLVLSIEHLFADPEQVSSVEWDFDNDGRPDETGNNLRTSTTFFRTGSATVRVLVLLANNTQAVYERTLQIQEPEELPFPVEMTSNPKLLVGTAPFTALFNIETGTNVARVEWTFGDGERGEGDNVAHTFRQNGSYAVQARVYSVSGSIANISSIVKVVDRLSINDLQFEGSHRVSGNRIEGEVPLTLSLTPKTSLPFVTFQWEAPDATSVGSTEETLQATYRREGKYTVTLIGQNAEGKVLRLPLELTVSPPSSSISFKIDPETGVAPLTIKLDASESFIPNDDITGFIWGFGDSSAKEVGGAFTQHTYQRAGTYVIDLTVQTAAGKSLNTTRTMTVRAPAFKACLLPSRKAGQAPLSVEFKSDCTTGNVTSVLWNFGDGTENDEREPVHVFVQPGTYEVSLTVYNASGQSDIATTSITVE